MNETEKNKLVKECSEQLQKLLTTLESEIGEPVPTCELYWGDKVIDGVETEGYKLSWSGEDDVEYESAMTAQEIIQTYHTYEYDMKQLMSKSVGLPHITDKYLELIETEKEECRKVLGEENKEYFKLL